MTETWLSNKDKTWCDLTDLNRDGYNLCHQNRTKGKGGGLALIYETAIKVSTVSKSDTRSFEYVTWKLTTKSRQLTLTGIYHPPYSSKNRITNSMFPDDFTEFTTNLLSNHTNNIILGDFNLHVSDYDNNDATIFMDTCEAMGLYQHVTFATHKSGNILDLMLTKVCNNTTILRTHKGPYISDHTAVIARLKIKRPTQQCETQMVRKVKDIPEQQWIDAFTDKDLI